MFGYVMVNREKLTEEQGNRFQACYCGLCRTLRRRHGLSGQMTLSFDMTFLLILLESLYEPAETAGEERCGPRPMKKHPYIESEIVDYAADMNVALAYHKLMDDWADERNLVKRAQAAVLKRQYAPVFKAYSRKCMVIESCIRELSAVERKKTMEIDVPANIFGKLLGELFIYRADIWEGTLRAMGEALGRFIYMMDAYDDFPSDEKKGNYNPLLALKGDNFEGICRQALTLLIAQCTEEFEKLPLVQDVEILRNILYSGVWAKYESIRRARAGARKGETK